MHIDVDILLDVILPIVITVIASSGFWLYLSKRFERRSLQSNLLIGLAHDRIIWLGMYYIRRGTISHDEYENLTVYLFKPYSALGGNGSVDRIMKEVDKLPITPMVIPTVAIKKET